MSKLELIIIALVIGLVLLFGYKVGKDSVQCPEIQSDTIMVYDTAWKTIYIDHYKIRHDTTIVTDTIPAIIDTMAVIRSYFAQHVYQREWRDSLVQIILSDTISQNVPLTNQISYQILQPQQIINNSVTNKTIYLRYLYAGLGVNTLDLKLTSLDLLLANPKWYAGAGWIPGIKGVNLRAGIILRTFKNTGQ